MTEPHMDLASYQDFKIDYTPELSELSKLKVTTNALGTGLRAKLTETLRQKRLIVAVGSQKRLAIEETRPTFDVNRDRIRELNELRNIGAARIPPWAEMHASKMFSRRRTKNVLLTQGHASASPSYAAKMVCDRLFSEPSKKKRVLERLTSDQLHEIEATERDKYKLKRRPLSELLGPCYEGQVPQEVNSSFFRGVSTDGSVADVKQQEAQPTHALAALPPSCAEWDDNTDVIRSLTPSGVIPAGAQSPSMTSILSYDECVECDSSDAPSHAIPPAPPSHAIPPAPSSHAIPPAPSSASQRHPSNSLPPHIANNPDFVAYIMRNKMEPVASAYISYKIANIGDTIDEQYADQISMALESVLTDTVETKISYVSFYKAAQKLILEGASVADRIFMLACFGRRILEGAPELHGIVKGYTQTVMEESVLQLIGNDGEWAPYAEDYTNTEISRDYDWWDSSEYQYVFQEFLPPSMLRTESTTSKDSKVLLSKSNSVEILCNKVVAPRDQTDDTRKTFCDNAPYVLTLGRYPSVSSNSSIRIVVPIGKHKRSRSDCLPRPVATIPTDPMPLDHGMTQPSAPVVPARKSAFQYVYDTAINLGPTIDFVHTVCGVVAYFANK